MAATAAANTTTFLVLTFFLVHLTLLNSHPHKFHRFLCDDWGIIGFPFSQNLTKYVDRCETNYFAKTIEFTNEVQHYKFVNLSSSDNIEIMPYVLEMLKDKENCEAFNNFTLASSSSISSFSLVVKDISIIKCNSGSKHRDVNDHCHGSILFYNKLSRETDDVPKRQGCLFAQWPVNKMTDSNPLPYGSYEYNRSLHVSEDCGKRGSKTKVIIASVVPGVFIIIICILGFIIWRRNKWRNHPYFLSRRMSSHLSTSTRDQEGGTGYLGVPVFSYKVLEEATNNFHPSKILGDGGFGTVYHGILRDGRQVAVKHLYENNCKRVEQFVNEIEIIKRLRHKNLVVLYGCTSRRSSELLLVYEYVPNGTLADHLHGDRANSVFLMWHIRMNIAIETATALSYLHACDIIHRDVKTNNILLGNHFCVKVADFGLSRSFPIGASHVSTAPQGTPGYVDPEYHQCYQLTDRSDVYSFGVVLIELVSSLPAVDITRHRHEINLANLAIDRIQRSAFNELIDPRLGYEKDLLIERMTTSVAELAFQCLQYDKEMRPSMDEVLNSLKGIQDYEFEDERSMGAPPSPEFEGDRLVKVVKFQSSPDVVTDKWVDSASTTPSASG